MTPLETARTQPSGAGTARPPQYPGKGSLAQPQSTVATSPARGAWMTTMPLLVRHYNLDLDGLLPPRGLPPLPSQPLMLLALAQVQPSASVSPSGEMEDALLSAETVL